VTPVLAVEGGNAALAIGGALTIVGSYLAIIALALRPRTSRADAVEASALVFLGIGAALGLWRVAFDAGWLYWAALLALLPAIWMLKWASKNHLSEQNRWIRWIPSEGGLLAVRRNPGENDDHENETNQEAGASRR
jgi:uncharacterized membrane protein YfcA